jgi:hypothetical protein
MDKRVEDIIVEMLEQHRELLLDLVQRVAKLEIKYSWIAGVWGTIGGLLAAIAVYFATRGG